jgi:hypothetical protein
VKERPILFSGPMARAILAGKKTQTRRVAKVARDGDTLWGRTVKLAGGGTFRKFYNLRAADRQKTAAICPYGEKGDRLWVRESFDFLPCDEPGTADNCEIVYWADGSHQTRSAPKSYKPMLYSGERFRPSIHMPRWASRLTLEVTDVRVQRLQDISEEDARAEGVSPLQMDLGSFRPAFEGLWDSINGKVYPWSSNPWVWVVSFRVVEPGGAA